MIPIRDTIPARNPPIATWTLIVVNAVLFLLELTMAPQELEQFVHLFGIVPARFMHPEWAAAVGLSPGAYWPFLTSMFLHGSGLHVLGNMWTLWIFGDNVPVLFLPLFFELPAVTYLAFWALSQVFGGTLSLAAPGGMGGIAWWAHMGGFAAGVILQFFFVNRGRDYRPLARDEYGLDAAWVPADQWRRHG
ncbi:MAG TPA: rhomboid family intramembrane serine protease [Gemmatimonadales bacterium]|nr:rhomboid family intramembrane serine protease [Gemmatimonadales bacterium]